MRVQVLQHVPFEGLGSIQGWMAAHGADLKYARFFEPYRLPPGDSPDLILAMGGPMSVNEEERFPWLVPEKQFIRQAILGGIPVLGICLGAQLIASAMGAKVYRGREREIGWYPVRAVPVAAECLALPAECIAFHWHGETFDLPEGAVRLAKSAGCDNQAFQLNRNAIGLQFHLETTRESASALLDNCREDLLAGPYVQAESEIRSAAPSSYIAINKVMDRVLNYLTAK